MEQDRYSHHHLLYILGMISLILCLVLLSFSLFILPFLIWKLKYNVPGIISNLLNLFEEGYDYSEWVSKLFVWLIFFIPSVITGVISYLVSNYIDNEIYQAEREPEESQENVARGREMKQQIKDSLFLGLKILGFMILIVILAILFQSFIKSTV